MVSETVKEGSRPERPLVMIEGQLESMGPVRKGEDGRVVIGREFNKYQ